MTAPRRPDLPGDPHDSGQRGTPFGVPGRQSGGPQPAMNDYSPSRRITVNDLINGNPTTFAHLDGVVEELTLKVQKELVKTADGQEFDRNSQTPAEKAALIEKIDRLAIALMLRSNSGLRGPDKHFVVATVINEIIGLGPIEPLWQDPEITEVIVNGPKEVYAERNGRIVRVWGARFRSQKHLLDICQRVLAPLNRKLDTKDPLADGRLPDGSRVNAVHTATAPKGPLLTIRRFPEMNRSLTDLVKIGSMSEDMACMLVWLIRLRATCLVVGGTGSGKTTLLNGLSAAIPHDERVVTIEDSLELRLDPRSHVAALEGRPADASGKNAITIRGLVKNALRMRPDRIIVGEVRDESALEMLQACNTGHEGSMSTVHANGPNEAISRLAVMVAQGGDIPGDKVDWLVGSALDIIVTVRRYKDGTRRISGVYEVPELDQSSGNAHLQTIPLWEWERTGQDANGRYTGEYKKRQEISDRLSEKLGLQWEPMPTYEEVERLCG